MAPSPQVAGTPCSLLFSSRPRTGQVLFVGDFFYPVDDLAVDLFRKGDVRHGRGRRGAVPMLLTRRDPHDITLPDLLDRPAPLLDPTGAGRHDQDLTARMGVPCSAGAGVERNQTPRPLQRIVRLEQGVAAHR